MTSVRPRLLILLVCLCMLAACGPRRDTALPLDTALIAAPQSAQRLVVILPGRADDLDALKRSGIAEAVHAAWPDAEVLLAEVTLGDYRDGGASRRLHDEVIVPARARGYRSIWLGGASMGGMGTLLYDIQYPGTVDGLFLLAPYLGGRGIVSEVRDAGGVADWNPGPPETIGADTFQREMWRYIKALSTDPAKANRVWLAYGDTDRLRGAISLLEPHLPEGHVLVLPGGHAWSVWSPALRGLLEANSASSR